MFEAKAKAGPIRGQDQGQDHRILSSSSRSVLEDTIHGSYLPKQNICGLLKQNFSQAGYVTYVSASP